MAVKYQNAILEFLWIFLIFLMMKVKLLID